jgi:hypothetical protein
MIASTRARGAFGDAAWQVAANGTRASVYLLCPNVVETGVEYPLNVTLKILTVSSDSPFYADYVSLVRLGERYASPWGFSSDSLSSWGGNFSVGTQFVAHEHLNMPDSMMGLFPGQSLQIQLHVSIEMTVVDTQGVPHSSHTDFFYGILVVAGDDAATYHGELQLPYYLGAAILVMVLILAIVIYEKRK